MNFLTPVAIRFGGQDWLPRYAKYVVGLDRLVLKASGGRASLPGIAGLPVLQLTVTGRTSGLPRTTALLYVGHDGRYLVAGSNWGGPTLPAWVHNLRAAGAGEVRIGGRRQRVRARQVTGPERAELWRVMVRTWPN